jgi:C1A family cysteine protease
MKNKILKYGWLPDIPDLRDHYQESTNVSDILKTIGIDNKKKSLIRTSVDLRKWCSPIEDQEEIGSCTANAGIGLIEYFERRTYGKHLNASRLFLYKVTRNLIGWEGDTGAFLRDTIKAMVLFGVPPESYSPYITSNYDDEPSSFCYAFAQNYKSIIYYRLDSPKIKQNILLKRIKEMLNAGLPSMFGFSIYSTINTVGQDGKIPFPSKHENRIGGHAVVAVGYDDKVEINNPIDNTITKGAILIRNSWGCDWGKDGYGWLPYKYIDESLAIDWWSLIRSDWTDLDVFNANE